MKNDIIIIEQEFNAPVGKVWKSLTDKDALSHWFFPIDEFKPEVGYTFIFYTGGEEQKYEHVCKITEIIENKKISYTWKYPDVDGDSVVTYELFPKDNNKTILVFTHKGICSFPQNDPIFKRDTFLNEWNEKIKFILKEYVEAND